MSASWGDQRVLVTGAAGFLGRHVVRRLSTLEPDEIFLPGRHEADLTAQAEVERLFAETKPDVVIHLAARVGGIGANRDHPGSFFYENLLMGLHLIEQARRHGTGKIVVVGTVCSYPKFASIPFREEDLWKGYPEETNAPYGIAKKALLVQLQAYRDQYGTSGIYLLPVNLYGPGDNFDPHSSHVIPALIRKCVMARESGATSIEVWGTGQATREFLYVDDAARGILDAARSYDNREPVNLGSGREISIEELTQMICRATGYEGEIRWDSSKPDGQPRRSLDTSRARREFGFQASTGLEEGLDKTVAWFLRRRRGSAVEDETLTASIP